MAEEKTNRFRCQTKKPTSYTDVNFTVVQMESFLAGLLSQFHRSIVPSREVVMTTAQRYSGGSLQDFNLFPYSPFTRHHKSVNILLTLS